MIKRLKSDRNIKELLHGSAIAIFFKGFALVAQYIFFWILARYYNAQGIGVFSILWTILQVFTVFSKLGFDTAIVKLIATYATTKRHQLIPKLYSKVILLIVLAAAIFTTLLAINSKWISILYFEDDSFRNYIIIIALAIAPLSLQYLNADVFKSLKQITLYSVFQNGSIYIISLLIILIGHNFYPEIGLIYIGIVSAIVILFLVSIVLIKKIFNKTLAKNKDESTGEKHKVQSTKSLLKLSMPMLLSNSLFLILNWTDIMMLGAFVDETEVGIYNIAIKIAAITAITLVGVNSIAMPKYAELYAKKNNDNLRKFVKQTTFLVISISLPVLIIIIAFPGFLLSLFGSEFKAGVNALLILSVGQAVSTFSSSTIVLLNMTGKEISVRNILMFAVVFNGILNYILIPLYGINGAAIATASSTVLWNLLAIIVLYRNFGFTTYPVNFNLFRKKK